MSYRDDVDTLYSRAMILQRELGDLLLVTKIVEELTDNRPGMDEKLRARLHRLASEIAFRYAMSSPARSRAGTRSI